MPGDKVGTGYVPIKPDSEGFGTELERQLDNEGTPAAGRAGHKMAQAMKGAFLAGAALIGKGVMDFAGFEQGMNEVFTLMPGISGEAMSEMSDQVKAFSAEFGVLPTETVPALYEALGAGIPPDNIFEFLETAQKLAKGGVTDLATSVDGLSSVVNAYGSDVISAGEASDIMFKIVGLGKDTLDDVAGSLFNVTPIASALGVSFEDVGAAMAVLSSKGTPVSVATTQIRSVLGELGKDGTKVADIFKERTGKSFQQFIADGGNLSNALHIIDDAAYESGLSMMDMFGSIEAGSAALSLMEGGGEAFASAIGQMENAAGSTEAAYDQMNQGLGNTLKQLRAQFAVTLLNIGEQIAPTVGAVGEGLLLLLEIFGKLPGPMQAVAVMIGTIGAGLFAFAGPILKGVKLFGMLGKSMSLLAANPWMLAAIALAAIAYLVITHWEEVSAFFVEFGETITEVWSTVYDATAGFATAVYDTVSEKFNQLADFFVNYWPLILGIFTGGLGLVVGLVIQHWDAIWTKTVEIYDAVSGKIAGAWNAAYAATTNVGGKIVGFITGIPSAITGAFVTLAETIAAPFRVAFQGIKTAWNSTVGGFGFDMPGWIPGLGGNSFRIPSMAAGGVLTGPQMVLAGEYPGAANNPEIVTPQSIMRETVLEALNVSAGGAGGMTVEAHLHVDNITEPSTFRRYLETMSTEVARIVQRELDRDRDAHGLTRTGIS